MRNWTPEERRKQAEAIRRTKPWEKSTGPRTEEGKRRSSRNAEKHGFDSAVMNDIRRLLRLQKAFVRNVLSQTPSPPALKNRERTEKEDAPCD